MPDHPSEDRFLPFTECMNFRHMGGYRTRDGRVTRADRLFRSCIFDLNTDEDLARFERLDIRKVFDFRMAEERKARPLLISIDAPPVVFELDIAPGSMGSYLHGLGGRKPEQGAIRERMTRWYADMARDARNQYRTLFQEMADCDGGILVLCNTGKDRSGTAAGLILTALGVADEIISEDFLLSAWAYRDVALAMKRYLSAHPLEGDTGYMSEVFTVYPEYMEAFWATATALAGSVNAYLSEHLELADERCARIRDRFTLGD